MRAILLVSYVLFFGSCTLLFLIDDRCKDGVISEAAGESCDDGNDASGDGCDEGCLLEDGFACPVPGEPCIPAADCGNGIIELGEECEDGNQSNTDSCVNCQNAACGDGFIQAGVETCDPPDGGECNAQCQIQCDSPDDCLDDDLCTENEDCVNNVCVNTAVEPDDGDQCTADVCDPDLGVINTTQNDGFLCEIGAGRDICLSGVCVLSDCGDGFLDAGNTEQCDDGNNTNTDACPNDCSPAICGDNSVEGAETCDDGNTTNGDGCDQSCQIEFICGDNIVDPGEQCDDGNVINADGCEGDCQFICGGSVGQRRSVQNDAQCLLFFETAETWPDAEASCVALGGHLVSITSATENARVETARGSNDPIIWIGLNDRAVEAGTQARNFVWSDGTPNNANTFENFNIAEPNSFVAGEDCVEMLASATWNDTLCSDIQGYVCER
jgi:cysteine-rich repeat protein